MHIFSEGEIRRRVNLVSQGLRERDVDVAFIHTADHVYYLTGVPLLSAWGRPMWAVVWADGRTAIIGAAIERETMEEFSHGDEMYVYDDEANVWDASLRVVSDLIKKTAPSPRVGIERSFLSITTAESLGSLVPAPQIDVADILFDARLVKSPEELELLRLAGDVAKIGADAFVARLTSGVTELAVAGAALDAMNIAMGALAETASTSTYVYCHFGSHTLTPHRHPTTRRLRRGDVVALNVFPVIWGYCIELERTYVFGDMSEPQAAALGAATRAFEFAKGAYRPGAVISELHAQATNMLRDEGYGEFVRHGTGHAHGIMIGQASREEGGELRSYNRGIVRTGMVNSIEPGIYIPELGGFRHSDVLVAEESRARLLTEFPVELPL